MLSSSQQLVLHDAASVADEAQYKPVNELFNLKPAEQETPVAEHAALALQQSVSLLAPPAAVAVPADVAAFQYAPVAQLIEV